MKSKSTLSRRSFISSSCLSAASLALCPKSHAVRKPNVVLIITDDQGYGDLACHGNPYIKTPNMDRLHTQSVRFTNFHVGPTCAPSRAALLTGRYCNRTGVWHTIMGRSLLRKDEITLADVFEDNGYNTGFFGKWHLGDNYPFRPEDRGFNEVVRHGGGGVAQQPDYWGNDYFDDTYYHNGKPQKYEGYCSDVWFDNAINFVSKNKDQPFFCYLSTNAPHSPYNVADKYSAPYKDNDKIPNANFYGMITNLDDNIARMEKTLDHLGLRDDTIFIFMTDNGTAAGVSKGKGFNAGMRGQKGSEYDGGHRVPFFIRWPNGGIKEGLDVKQITSHIDVMPTLIDLCTLSKDNNNALDGTSLAKLLRGKILDWPERVLVTDSQRVDHPVKWRKSAVMTDKWRLINGLELYDMDKDHGQKLDIASNKPTVVSRLRNEYEKWWSSVSSRFGEYCEIIIGSDNENPVKLTSHDWHGDVVPWNQQQVRSGMQGNGIWALDVAKAGQYQFQLRRWPAEIDKPINSPIPAEAPVPGGFQYGVGKSFNITKARLKIAHFDESIPVSSDDKVATFLVNLKKGKTRLQTWFSENDNKPFGSYYVYVKRL